jgi:hypothetical protein
MVVLSVGTLLVGRSRTVRPREARRPAPATLLLVWLAGTLAVLLVESPLWRPHVSQLVPGLALLVAVHRPPARVLAVVALAAVPYHLVHVAEILRPSGYASSSEQTLGILRSLPEGALAISDDPGIVWRAGRRTTPDLVDASILRIQTGDITAASIAAATADDRVCAVVVRSSERWGSFEDLPDRLAAAGFDAVQTGDLGRGVYVARDCRPG